MGGQQTEKAERGEGDEGPLKRGVPTGNHARVGRKEQPFLRRCEFLGLHDAKSRMKCGHPKTELAAPQTLPFSNNCLLQAAPKPGLGDMFPACPSSGHKQGHFSKADHKCYEHLSTGRYKKSVYVKVPLQRPSSQNKLWDKIAEIKFW